MAPNLPEAGGDAVGSRAVTRGEHLTRHDDCSQSGGLSTLQCRVADSWETHKWWCLDRSLAAGLVKSALAFCTKGLSLTLEEVDETVKEDKGTDAVVDKRVVGKTDLRVVDVLACGEGMAISLTKLTMMKRLNGTPGTASPVISGLY